jgi:hypothetical protein
LTQFGEFPIEQSLADKFPAESWEYNEVLASVRDMWNESQFCLTGAQLSVLPDTIQDHIYEQCPDDSLADLG